MHIADILSRDSVTTSFEFFPPRNDAGWDSLFHVIADFEKLQPSFVSVTYGAAGSTRARTHELVVRLKTQTKLDPIPHLTCANHTRADIQNILQQYAQCGVSNILALRGDAPLTGSTASEFQHAVDLVKCIHSFNQGGGHPDRRGFGIGVAGFPEGHPDTPNTLIQMDHLRAKVDAGADYICSQLFFNNAAFFDWRERCELAGIRVPVMAGIMPITNIAGLKRMADLAGGTTFPAKLLRAVQRCGDDADAVERVGIHWATEQCMALLDGGVRGIHLYTLNKCAATQAIFQNLGIKTSAQLR
jgi:methylenetetrahydrofolate reductase (NADPH)